MIIHALRLWVSEVYERPYRLWYSFERGDWVAGPASEYTYPSKGLEWWSHFNKVLGINSELCWPKDYD